MPTTDITAGDVLDGARALLNDQAAQIFTNTNLLSYLKTAFRELRETGEESNIPVTNYTETVLSIPASTSYVSFLGSPPLPSDLVEIQQVWQRTSGTTFWTPVTRTNFIPSQLEGVEYSEVIYWAWMNNNLYILPSNQETDLKLLYIQQVADLTDENSLIGIINGQSFLEYRVAALAARYMMENPERAQDLDANAQLALDRVVNIENKARQSIFTRRRPFRANWKRRVSF